MSLSYVVDGETELDSALFNPWVDHMNGLQTGALPIALAGIEGALGEHEPLQNMRAGVANVLDYGAVGDGSHDDTSAIQAAIAAAGIGGTIVFPPPLNLYKVTTTLLPLDNQRFIGGDGLQYGHASGRKSHIHKSSAPGGVFYLDSKVGVSFVGLVITGTISTTDATECGIHGSESSWISITGCHLWGFGGPGIKATRTSAGVAWSIRDCLATACVAANDSLSDYVGAVDLETHDNYLIGNEFGCTTIYSTDYDWRAACVIRSDANFITSNVFEVSAVGLVFRITLGKCILNAVIGNRADLNFHEGFQLEGSNHQIIGNRSFRNSRAAHNTYDGFVTACTETSFIGNTVMCRDTVDAELQMRHGFTDTSSVTDASSNVYLGNTARNISGNLYNITDADNQVLDFRTRTANADTSGATLGQLETEVNEIKALLRTQGLLKT